MPSIGVWLMSMIAYFILVHRYPKQFKRLFNAIYCKDNCYAIHVDRGSDISVYTEIRDFLRSFPNVVLLKSKRANWGGYSLVDAELRGMEALLKINQKWKFFINLSGQDFPLQSQQHIASVLQKHPDKNFIKVLNQREMRPKTISRFETYCIELKNRIVRTSCKRKFLHKVTPYIGNQWMIASRDFCEFICTSPEVNKYKKFYKHTFISDESFFQTVIMNTKYKASVINDDKREIDWIPEGNIKLRPRTFTLKDIDFLRKSKNFFARKFDQTVDGAVLTALEKHAQVYVKKI